MASYFQNGDVIQLRPTVNVRRGAPEKAERAAGKASSAPITDHPRKRVSLTGRPRSVRPLLAFVALTWALIGWAVWG